ncbi:MAG: alanine racemase [Acidobacteria bacterium]|nr:alanine racemase [Acidobacteriota bacterium]
MAASHSKQGLSIYDLDTPATLIDLDRLERNIREWQASMDGHGVKFRPHIKTHKIPEIARMQVAAGAVGIVCAKVSEAEPFAAAGVEDICIAYPVFGEVKWQRIAELARNTKRVTVNCDCEEAARGLSKAAAKAGVTIYLQIDIDSGLHRGGVPNDDPVAIEKLARVIESLPGLKFSGITTYRSSGFPGAPSPRDAGHAEGRLLVEVATQLRNAGIEVHEVTAGSTPTGKWVAEVAGVTEVRAGNYVFNDLMQLGNSIADESQLGLSVLCTVASHNQADRLTIDGGSKTFSGDAGGVGSGRTAPAAIARAVDRKIFVERLNEEHGMARTEEKVTLGEKIRFFPYHACTCANLSDEIIGFRGERVEVVWPVRARGLRT